MFYETKDRHRLNIIDFIVLLLNLCKKNYPLALKRHRWHTLSYFYNTDLKTKHKSEYLHKPLYCTNIYDFPKNINTQIYRWNKTEVTIQDSYKENKSRLKVKSSKTEAFRGIIVLHSPYFIRASTLSLNPGIWTITKRYALR